MEYTTSGPLDILTMVIYVNDNYMTKFVYLKEVAYSFRISMDTKDYHAMLVHYSKDKAYLLMNM